jgi:hypothetical protein
VGKPGKCQGCQPIRGAKTSLKLKYLKNVGLKGHQIISLPGAPTCLGPALLVVLVLFIIITIKYLNSITSFYEAVSRSCRFLQ